MKNILSTVAMSADGKVWSGCWRMLAVAMLLLAVPVWGAVERQTLGGHVPAVIKSLAPVAEVAGSNHLSLSIGLPLRNQAGLDGLIRQIYDRKSTNYHHYLKPAQFAAQFGPMEADYQAVVDFARAHGLTVTGTYSNRMIVKVAGSVADIQTAFHTKLHSYRHPRENRTFYAPDTEPSLDLAVPVLHISGLDNYLAPHPMNLKQETLATTASPTPNDGTGPSGSFMGNDFRAAYVPDTSLTGAGQSVALVQFNSGFYQSDIDAYVAAAGLSAVPIQTILLDGYDGGPGIANDEVSLDIEMAISMAPGLASVMVYEGNSADDILNRIAMDNQAQQISASWSYPVDATTTQIYQQFAAQGQSFFNASGDDDAWVGVIPSPSDNPYITIVGGTTLTMDGAGNAWSSETVWNWGNGVGSGGGTSTIYAIPSWQANVDMTANGGSATMRNIPDVAMAADKVWVYFGNGNGGAYGGTSCATPLWAAFAALVNQQAAATGEPAVGFLNPALYQIGSGPNYNLAFHDIATGNNTSDSSPNRYYAATGYDLCTGWGTPAGQYLINALANPEPMLILPGKGFTSAGGAGGPFTVTSQNLVLTNTGNSSISWSLANGASWLGVNKTSGTLSAHGTATVAVSLNGVASNLTVGTYTGTVAFTDANDGAVQDRVFTLNVVSPPVITGEPANVTTLDGATATFMVSVTGDAPLYYQWYHNGTNLVDGGGISGSTTAMLTLANVSSTNVGVYAVVVSNVAQSVTSDSATLALTASEPVIMVQPVDFASVAGRTAEFSVSAIGSKPFSYQWSWNGTNILGATNSVLSLTNVQVASSGIYAVTVTNIYGEAVSSNATLSVYDLPVITAVNPSTGVPGMVVNISGLGFSPVAASNIVRFGAVQGVVTSASVTNLAVVVPTGATHAPITETVNGLVAYSSVFFEPTFYGDGSSISLTSFGPQQTITTSGGPIASAIGDLDGDGKPDFVIATSAGQVGVFQNIGGVGSLGAGSFAAEVDLPLPSGGSGAFSGVMLADVDGDGKLDILVCNSSLGWVVIYRNISTGGTLTTDSFAAPVVLITGADPRHVRVADLDGDGRPDVICANSGSGTISIFRNIGVAGTLTTDSFAPRVDLACVNQCQDLAVADLDGDGKPDLAVVNFGATELSLFRNVSTIGVIDTNSFTVRVDLPAMTQSQTIMAVDVDGDGKLDLVTGANGDAISIYRNTATSGVLTTNSFAAAVNFATPGWAHTVGVGDVNGDGKPDIGVVGQMGDFMSMFENVSQTGNITNTSLANRVDYAAGNNPWGVSVGDLDGDGRPDVIFCNQYGNTISIYQNQMPFGGAPVITSQPESQTTQAGGLATFSVAVAGVPPLSYQWNWNGTNIIGATNAVLALTNVQPWQAGNYSVTVTNLLGEALSSNAVLSINIIPPAPPFISVQPVNQFVAAGGLATFTVAAGGTPPLAYQWIWNGTNILGATNFVLTLTNVQVASSGIYAVTVTNIYGEAVSSNATLGVYDLPVITAVNPSTGVPGMVVNISGLGFSPVAASNIVRFGAVQGVVTSASVTNLAVVVPTGATHAPITETVNGLVAYSSVFFEPTFYGRGSNIATNSFGGQQTITTSGGPIASAIGDLNGDGKPDFVIAASAGHVGVFQNIGGIGSLGAGSFAAEVDLPLPSGGGGTFNGVTLADVDGDGKLDILVCNSTHGWVVIYRNISTGGTLTTNSFAAPVVLITGADPRHVRVADLDGDGRPDVICANSGSGTISIFQNIGVAGTLTTNSFAPRVDLACVNQSQDVAVADFDGDGKPDLAVVNFGATQLSLFRNVSTIGVIATNSFAARVDLPAMTQSQTIMAVDVDGDGKLDLVTGANGDAISIYRNTATPGVLTTNSFAAAVNFATPGWAHTVGAGDINGDGKPDIGVVGQTINFMSIFQNVSQRGSITNTSLASRVDYAAGSNAWGLSVGDLDGDGRPDVIFCNYSGNAISIYQNQMPYLVPPVINVQPTNIMASVGGTAMFSVALSGSTPLYYQWNWNGVKILGATNSSLTLTNLQWSQAGIYSVAISNVIGSIISSNAILTITPDHFAWGRVSASKFVNVPFSVIIQAQSVSGAVVTNYNGYVNLTSTNGISVTPSISGGFSNGVWNGSVVIPVAASNVVLKADDGFGHYGLANSINVVNPPALSVAASGQILLLHWPVNVSGFGLETSSSLAPAQWTPVAGSPIQIGQEWLLPVIMSDTNRFYRLRYSSP